MNYRHVRLPASVTAVAVAASLSACGSSATSSSSTAATTQSGTSSRVVTVAIAGYAYRPVNLAVPRGTRVKFVNHDSTAHTATTTSAAFDSGTLKQGQSAIVSLTKSGSYAYICQFHAFMHGTVTVK